MSQSVSAQIETCLREAFAPEHIAVHDDSAVHAGHSGQAAHGGGHFSVHVVSSAFEGKSAVQRHRQVYQALNTLMEDAVHAISINAQTPAEYRP